MIKITFTIEDTENPDALINETSEENFNDIEELVFWLRDVMPSNLYSTIRMQNKIRKYNSL